ncbi:MAG: putative tpr repeat protein [Parcubacteria group bacterium Licking1014_1]|nr:MAG: putative tpr repeat protein [Parcubacteria group bacterium Licking1014_1]
MTKDSFFVKICDAITKYSIYAAIFLMPIFFLPWTSDGLDFNKQALLILFVFVALFSWMAKVLISGSFNIGINKTHIAVLVLFLVYLASTIFSQDRYGSFWGWPRTTSESLLAVTGLVVLYFIISNVFSKKEIFISVVLLAFSCILSILIGLLQLSGLFISFNTIGSVAGLGFFAAVFLPLLFALIIYSGKWLKIIFGAGIILNFIVLFFINYQIVWWLVLAGSVLFVLLGALKRDIFDLRWLSLAMFFLVLALFFIVLKPQMPVPARPIDIFLSQQATLDIAVKTIKDRTILGSGPGTFAFDFSKHKKIDFNQGMLWNARFDRGASKILNILATTGILGLISFLALISAILFYGAKFMLARRETEEKKGGRGFSLLIGGILLSFIVQTIGYFLYSSNLSLDFLYFFLLASFAGLSFSERKNFSLNPSSLLTLGVTFIFTIIFIFGLGLLILGGQRYVAEVNYFLGETALASGKSDIDEGIQKIGKAVSLNPNVDIYLTELSRLYLLKISQVGNDNKLSEEDKTKKMQILVNNSINAAKLATDASPSNVSNWSARGYIYQNLIGVIDGADEWAFNSYDQAIQLDPNNPYYPVQKGIIYITKSLQDKTKTEEKNQLLIKAKEQLDKAIQLKSDYATARFQLAMVYQEQNKTEEALQELESAKKAAPNDIGLAFQIGLMHYQKKDFQKAQSEFERAIAINPDYSNGLYFLGLTYSELGQKNKALEKFSKVAELNPDNQELKKIISNLNSGKKPLDGIIQETPPQAPIEGINETRPR